MKLRVRWMTQNYQGQPCEGQIEMYALDDVRLEESQDYLLMRDVRDGLLLLGRDATLEKVEDCVETL